MWIALLMARLGQPIRLFLERISFPKRVDFMQIRLFHAPNPIGCGGKIGCPWLPLITLSNRFIEDFKFERK